MDESIHAFTMKGTIERGWKLLEGEPLLKKAYPVGHALGDLLQPLLL
jgi:hypothetical protein